MSRDKNLLKVYDEFQDLYFQKFRNFQHRNIRFRLIVRNSRNETTKI